MNDTDSTIGMLIRSHLVLTLPLLAAALVLPSAAGAVIFLVLIVCAASQSVFRQIQAIGLQFLFMNLNGELFHSPASGGLHHALPFVVIFRMIHDQRLQIPAIARPVLRSLLFVGVALVFHSLFVSVLPFVSLLKASGFTLYALMCVLVFTSVSEQELLHISRWYKSLVGVVVLASAPLLFSPLGRSINGTGFNGILSHPNLMGVFLGISLAALLANSLATRRYSFLELAIIAVGLPELYFTEARGGMFSLILALALWYGGVLTIQSSPRAMRILGRGIIVAAFAIPAVFVTSATLQESFARFVSKSGRTTERGLVANFRSTRGGAIGYHTIVFRRHMTLGQGFQVVNSGTLGLPEVKYDPIWKKIPISASVENGFLYTSIFAELGWLGAIPVILLLLAIMLPVIQARDNPSNVLLFSVLFTNMTEAALFSPSGVGGWEWQMIGMYLASHALASGAGANEELPEHDSVEESLAWVS